MKTLLFALLLVPVLALSQTAGEKNFEDWLKKKSSNGTTTTYTQIFNRSFAGGVTDTVEELHTSQYKTILLALQSKDSVSVLISYRLSTDKSTWTSFSTLDSLKQNADGSVTKSLDLTSTIGAHPYIQLRFTTSALAYPLGTTTPTYSAKVILKKY